jgi:hypothetical protein
MHSIMNIMISIDSLLGMVATEAAEAIEESRRENPQPRQTTANDLPPINYKLELVQDSDGNLYWVE